MIMILILNKVGREGAGGNENHSQKAPWATGRDRLLYKYLSKTDPLPVQKLLLKPTLCRSKIIPTISPAQQELEC